VRRAFVDVVAVAVGVALLSACSGNDASGRPTSSGPGTLMQSDASDPVLSNPLVAELEDRVPYLMTSADMNVVASVTQQAVATCMSQRGFDYEQLDGFTDISERPAHPLDLEAAQRYGYHLVPGPAVADPNAASIAQDEDFAQALDGFPDGREGCIALGSRYAEVENSPYDSTTQKLNQSLFEAIAVWPSTDLAITAEQSWSTCIEGRGYDPKTYQRQVNAFFDLPQATPDEIELRLADFDCDVASSRTASYSSFLATTYSSWLDLNAVAIDSAVKEKETYIQALQDLIALLQTGSVTF
jgi:hypothetical protein